MTHASVYLRRVSLWLFSAFTLALGATAQSSDATDSAIFEHCTSLPDTMAMYFDCQCVAENSPAFRQELADKKFDAQQRKIAPAERSLEANRKQLEAETDPNQIKIYERKVANDEKKLATLKARPDPQSIPISAVVEKFMRTERLCRDQERTREAVLNACVAKGKSESACSCPAEKTAETWMEYTGFGRLKDFDLIQTKANLSCGGLFGFTGRRKN